MVMGSYSVLSVTKLPQSGGKDSSCGLCHDCPLVSVSEMRAKLAEGCSYYPERKELRRTLEEEDITQRHSRGY